MKRLIEERPNPNSPEARLLELIQAMPVLERAPFVSERIFARVTSEASAAGRRKRLPWAAGVAALGLCATAFAATAVTRLAVSGQVPPAAPAFASPPSPLTTPVPPPPAVAAVPEVGGATPEGVLQDQAVGHVLRQASPSTGLKLRRRSIENSPPAGGEDPTPVLEAIRTLRSNGDPARAGMLLAEYLKEYPHSLLSEDALALSIEAATARHDSRSSAELARRYLAQFPSGRYRTFALRAAQPNASFLLR